MFGLIQRTAAPCRASLAVLCCHSSSTTPTQQVSVLPSRFLPAAEEEQPIHLCPRDAAAMCPTAECLGAAAVLSSGGPAAPLQICWDELGKTSLQSAVQVQLYLLLAWYYLRTAFWGCCSPTCFAF